MNQHRTTRVLIVALVLFCSCAPAPLHTTANELYPSREHTFRIETVASGLQNPWSIAFVGEDFLVSERRGRLWRISRNGEKSEVTGLPPISAVGQGGLLDIEVARDFSRTKQIFFSYSTATRRGAFTTAIGKAILNGSRLTNVQTIFTANNSHASGHHFGSRISQLADGTLVFSIGDRGRRDDAQEIDIHAGSVLRIDTQGNAPADNPFIGKSGYLPELYSIGHRNIQGMALASDGSLFTHEHGPQGGDEINRIIGGKNYGWPTITYGREYRTGDKIGLGTSSPGYEDPLFQWTPSIAPSGLLIYSGKLFPRWKGDMFVGALAGRHIARMGYEGEKIVEKEQLLRNNFGRIRDIKEDNDGNIYFINDTRNGKLYRITTP